MTFSCCLQTSHLVFMPGGKKLRSLGLKVRHLKVFACLQDWVHCLLPEAPLKGNADCAKYFFCTCLACLYLHLVLTIKWPYAAFWHGGGSDTYQLFSFAWKTFCHSVLTCTPFRIFASYWESEMDCSKEEMRRQGSQSKFGIDKDYSFI